MTNLTRLVRSAFVLIAACMACEPSVRTNPDRPSTPGVAHGAWAPPVVSASSPVASASPSPSVSLAKAQPPSDEPVIREYQELGREPAKKADLEAFVAAHPQLLTAKAHPYGPTIMWLLEYERETAALVLYNAGATTPPEALALAARGGLDAFLKAMLAKGANPNGGDDGGYTPLHAAAKYGHVSAMRILLAAKANPSAREGDDGDTPLHLAVIDRREEAIAVLIAAKADLEAKDNHGRTPLHWGPFAYTRQAVHIYHDLRQPHGTRWVDPGPAKGMKMLLDAGAKIDAVDDEGDTPLHEAARLGSVRGAEILLARGAKPNVKNKAGETPLSIAAEAEMEHRRAVLDMLKRGR